MSVSPGHEIPRLEGRLGEWLRKQSPAFFKEPELSSVFVNETL